MTRLKAFFSDKVVIFVTVFVLIISVAVAFGFKNSKGTIMASAVTEIAGRTDSAKATGAAIGMEGRRDSVVPRENLSKAVLNVDNMSCSGCISTIKSSVAGFRGIKETLVEISSGKVELYFDGDEIKDLSLVAKAITDSG